LRSPIGSNSPEEAEKDRPLEGFPKPGQDLQS
jgi:hypothetical protein